MLERGGKKGFENQQRALLARPDIDTGIDTIRVPTLVAVGDRDRISTRTTLAHLASVSPEHGSTSFAHPATGNPGAVTMLMHEWLDVARIVTGWDSRYDR